MKRKSKQGYKRVFSRSQKHHLLQPLRMGFLTQKQVASDNALSVRTIRRWQKQSQSDQTLALTQSRADKGKARILMPELAEYARSLALGLPDLTIRAITGKVGQKAVELGLSPPKYHSIYRHLQKLEPGLITLAAKGIKAYRQTHELAHRWEREKPNELWQADHTLLDIQIKTDQGTARPWLTVIIDDCTRMVCAFRLSLSAPTAQQTALALRDAIWHKEKGGWPVCGIPDTLYVDNGTDFTSGHFYEACLRLQIKLIHSRAYVPQGRGKIERFFETINQGLLRELPGYTKSLNPSVESALLNLTQLEDQLYQFLINHYHHRVHSSLTCSPIDRWQQTAFLPRKPETLAVLDDFLAREGRPRKVQKDGISLYGLRYTGPSLAAYVGESVTIRYDPRDMGEVKIYRKEEFIGRAFCSSLTSTTVPLKDIIKARKAVRKGYQQKIEAARQYLETDQQHRTELPILAPIPSELVPPPPKSEPISSLKLFRYDLSKPSTDQR